jgi:CheY-like chemotaxis protein
MIKTIITIPKNLSVLIVEDSDERIGWFRNKLSGMDVTVCMTPDKALNVLGTHRFDLIFLDHDAVPVFVDESDPDHRDKTFWRVAELLERTEFSGDVVIHSANPHGAERMRRILARHAHVQKHTFGTFEIVQGY